MPLVATSCQEVKSLTRDVYVIFPDYGSENQKQAVSTEN